MFFIRLSPFQRVICSMEGALPFLVGLSNHRNLDIVENSSGILRNLSSYIVQCDEAERFRYVRARCKSVFASYQAFHSNRA